MMMSQTRPMPHIIPPMLFIIAYVPLALPEKSGNALAVVQGSCMRDGGKAAVDLDQPANQRR